MIVMIGMICVLVIIAFIIWMYYINSQINQHEPYIFLTPTNLSAILNQNENNYLSNMTPEDIRRRGKPGPLPHWTNEQKKLITNLIQQIPLNFNGIMFGLIDDTYEGDMPHTRNNTIVLPISIFTRSETRIIQILIHEFLHIKQKQHPKLFEKLYNIWDFTPYNGNIPTEVKAIVRNNPDTNGLWLWKNKYIMLPVYIDEQGMQTKYILYHIETNEIHINNIIQTQFGQSAIQPEHPAELSATILSDYILKKSMGSTRYEILAIEWFEQYKTVFTRE